jgi:hypothetical protein
MIMVVNRTKFRIKRMQASQSTNSRGETAKGTNNFDLIDAQQKKKMMMMLMMMLMMMMMMMMMM